MVKATPKEADTFSTVPSEDFSLTSNEIQSEGVPTISTILNDVPRSHITKSRKSKYEMGSSRKWSAR